MRRGSRLPLRRRLKPRSVGVPHLGCDSPFPLRIANEADREVAGLAAADAESSDQIGDVGSGLLRHQERRDRAPHPPSGVEPQGPLPELLDLRPPAGTRLVVRQEHRIAGVELSQRSSISVVVSGDVAGEQLVDVVDVGNGRSREERRGDEHREETHHPLHGSPPGLLRREDRPPGHDAAAGALEMPSRSTSALILPRHIRPYIFRSPTKDQSGY